MKSMLIKTSFLLKAIAVIIVFLFGVPQISNADTPMKEDTKALITLTLAFAWEQNNPLVIFDLKNNSSQDFPTSPVFTNESTVTIEGPDGTSKEIFSILEMDNPILVKPNESRIEKILAEDLIDSARTKKAGYYRIYWKIWKPTGKGKESVTYKSNDLIFHKKEDARPE